MSQPVYWIFLNVEMAFLPQEATYKVGRLVPEEPSFSRLYTAVEHHCQHCLSVPLAQFGAEESQLGKTEKQ